MSSLTSLRLDYSYKGTSQEFVVEWMEKLKQYEALTSVSEHFPDMMKKNLLQNSINGIRAFRDLKSTDELDISKGQGAIGYHEYVGLIQKVSANVDSRGSMVRQSRVNFRKANVHNYYPSDEIGDDEYHYFCDDRDEELDEYSISYYKGNRSYNQRPALRKDVWETLSAADKITWDQMSYDGKWAVMISHKKSMDENNANNTIENEVTPSKDVTAHDNNHTPHLLSALNNGNSLEPSDIRRVMSPRKKDVKWNVKSLELDDQVPTRYQVSRANNTVNFGSLVDRVANGVLAGTDVIIICKLDRMVDVTGIDNHQMGNLQLVTSGGVVTSQKG